MGRYRPRAAKSTKIITREGADALRRELDYLWKEKRPAVTRSVAEAAAQGDRSENAEYIYGKRQLAEIDRRIRFLRKRLDGMRIVEGLPADTGRVYFGAWFELIDDAGQTRVCRLVGPDELDADTCYVSIDSPLGKAVVGKDADSALSVTTPGGAVTYIVRNIRYTDEVPGKKKPDRRSG